MTQRHWAQNLRLMMVTTITKDRKPIFRDPVQARVAVESIYSVQSRCPFFLYGFVIMPDHCHLLLSIPEEGSLSRIMHAYKRGVAFELNMGPIWQPRFHCKFITRYGEALKYIHQNPVSAGLCKDAREYAWSSACGKWDVITLDFVGGFA